MRHLKKYQSLSKSSTNLKDKKNFLEDYFIDIKDDVHYFQIRDVFTTHNQILHPISITIYVFDESDIIEQLIESRDDFIKIINQKKKKLNLFQRVNDILSILDNDIDTFMINESNDLNKLYIEICFK